MKPLKTPNQNIGYRTVNVQDDALSWKNNNSLFEFVLLDEVQAQVMAILFIISVFVIVFVFNSTVITILEASKLFALFASLGFLLAFIGRMKLNLSVVDGLFYGGFGLAPITLAGLLLINSFGEQTIIEKYKIADRIEEGSGYTFTLEDDALEDYWHIRNLHRNEVNGATGFIKYTFKEGIFGYKYLKAREVVRE